jgi:hypothetical protein
MPTYITLLMLLLLAAISPSSLACDAATEQQIAELKTFLKQDPVVSARKAIESNKITFWGVAGYTVTIPGIDEEKCDIEKFPTYIVPGTSDVVCGDRHHQLIIKAKALSEKYNKAIKADLERKSLLKCSK